MNWALDASAALSQAIPDESSAGLERLILEISAGGEELWVPALWWYEVANGIVVAERHERLTPAQAQQAFEALRALGPKTDPEAGPELSARILALSREHGISAYDAAYLELAERLDLELLTLDRALARAARKAGVRVRRTP